jgi:Flp pilus assembly protein TadG
MIARFRSQKRRGAIVVLAAVLMTVLAGMIAFAVDCGMITLAREQLQNAADSAAIAGADALAKGANAAQTAAQSFAQANVAGGTSVVINPAQDIELGAWDTNALTFTPLTGPALASANSVRVTCRMSQARGNSLKLFFAPIFGIKTADVSAQAVALLTTNVCGPFIGVNSVNISGGSYTDSYNSSLGPYSRASAGSKGTVCSNGNISLSGGGTINGDAHPGIDKTVNASGGSSVTGSKTALTEPLNEPAVNPGNAATVNNNSNIPLTWFGKTPLDSQGNFSLSGDLILMPSGTYYFSSFTVSGGSWFVIMGPTVIYCTGNFDASGGTMFNITNLPVDCQIYSTGTNVALSGGVQFDGVVYAPAANITRSGSADFFGMLIGASLTLSGGGGCHYDESLSSLIGAQQTAQLVQ